jgi:hypothetical protein
MLCKYSYIELMFNQGHVTEGRKYPRRVHSVVLWMYCYHEQDYHTVVVYNSL